MDNLYKALADKTRRKILELLKQSDMTVNEIGSHFPITGASLSHHLDILKRARLVVTEREGQFIRYSLNVSVFEDIVERIINLLQK
jgi:ArsR family transcriptional regulator, arsenate/arsenite/antimonite-responsive transcriptional repressor